MNKSAIIAYSALMLMVLFLVISFVTTDILTSKLMVSFGIIAGVFTTRQISKLNEQ